MRWRGFFKLKEPTNGELGHSGVGDNDPEYDADICHKRDIDFEFMLEDSKKKAAEYYDWFREQTAKNSGKISPWHNEIPADMSKEQYVKENSATFTTHALLIDGKWYENGEMGWWGIVHNAKDPNIWEKEYAKLIKELPDEALFVLVDCHI